MVEPRHGSKWSLHQVSEVRIFFELICAMNFYDRNIYTELRNIYTEQQKHKYWIFHGIPKAKDSVLFGSFNGEGGGGQKGQWQQKEEGGKTGSEN